MPKKINNNKKKANKKYKNSSEETASASHNSEVTRDSQSEILNSVSDDMLVSKETTSSASDDMIDRDSNSRTASDDSLLVSETDVSESDELVYVKSKKAADIKSNKTIPVKSKKIFRIDSKDPLQNIIKADTKKNDKYISRICFEDINEQFSIGKYYDFPVIIAKKNGFINCTKLCQEFAKQSGSTKVLKKWLQRKNTKKIIRSVSSRVGIDTENLIFFVKNGINKIRGSYTHNLLIIHIATWLSADFAVKISKWIEEWKLYSPENEIRFQKALSNIKSNNSILKEREIQKILHEKFGGKIEVETDVGFIDILTKKYIIEIKCYNNWKHAIGQLIAYSSEYQDRKKIMYLFDVPKNNIIDKITDICATSDIHVRIYNDL